MSAPSSRTVPIRYQVLAFTAARTVLNIGYRLVYPFLPALARGLGVDLQTMALAVTARSLLGLLTPLFGSLADQWGRRWVMLAGLVLFAAGLAVAPVGGLFGLFLLGLLIANVGKSLFDPAMQAYLGDRVIYQRRGLALATTELGWSLAGLLGLPLVGILMARQGWQAPFSWLAGLGIVTAGVLLLAVPSDRPAGARRTNWRRAFGLLLSNRAALAGLSVGVMATLANETVNIVYGAWLETSFNLQLATLGAAAAVIGIAELSGEGLVAGLADRYGKKRLLALALLASVLTSLILPILDQSAATATAGLFFFYLSFEVVVVSSIPLMTELLPGARATMMASNVAGFSLGRAGGALIGPLAFQWGLLANGLLAAVIYGLALLILLRLVHLPAEERA